MQSFTEFQINGESRRVTYSQVSDDNTKSLKGNRVISIGSPGLRGE